MLSKPHHACIIVLLVTPSKSPLPALENRIQDEEIVPVHIFLLHCFTQFNTLASWKPVQQTNKIEFVVPFEGLFTPPMNPYWTNLQVITLLRLNLCCVFPNIRDSYSTSSVVKQFSRVTVILCSALSQNMLNLTANRCFKILVHKINNCSRICFSPLVTIVWDLKFLFLL